MIKWFGPTVSDNYLSEGCYLEVIPNEYIGDFMLKRIRERIAKHDQHYILVDNFKIIYPPTPTSRTWGYMIKIKKNNEEDKTRSI